jgi:hypothetical protein
MCRSKPWSPWSLWSPCNQSPASSPPCGAAQLDSPSQLRFLYVARPRTIFTHVYSLPRAHCTAILYRRRSSGSTQCAVASGLRAYLSRALGCPLARKDTGRRSNSKLDGQCQICTMSLNSQAMGASRASEQRSSHSNDDVSPSSPTPRDRQASESDPPKKKRKVNHGTNAAGIARS